MNVVLVGVGLSPSVVVVAVEVVVGRWAEGVGGDSGSVESGSDMTNDSTDAVRLVAGENSIKFGCDPPFTFPIPFPIPVPVVVLMGGGLVLKRGNIEGRVVGH